jgi:hypothetical protein
MQITVNHFRQIVLDIRVIFEISHICLPLQVESTQVGPIEIVVCLWTPAISETSCFFFFNSGRDNVQNPYSYFEMWLHQPTSMNTVGNKMYYISNALFECSDRRPGVVTSTNDTKVAFGSATPATPIALEWRVYYTWTSKNGQEPRLLNCRATELRSGQPMTGWRWKVSKIVIAIFYILSSQNP